jgi:hypothetical protein
MSHPISTAGTALLGRLPGLFDKRFVVSAFLPAVAFSIASLWLATDLGLVDIGALWAYATTEGEILGGAGILLALWLLALSLLAANNFIIRRLEGYGPWRRLGWMMWWERRKFRRLRDRIAAAAKGSLEQRRLQSLRATLYPPREEELLPRAFGNVVRAFESYAPEVYGFEATRGWTRLLAVLPQDFRQVVDDARSQVDFLAHVWALSWLFLGEYFVLGAWTGKLASVWFPVGALVSIRLSSWRAWHAAVGWGETIKAGFDVFLPELRRRLGLPRPTTREEEREMWAQFSEAFLTGDRKWLPPLGAVPASPSPGPEEGEKAAEGKPHLRSV